MWRNWNLQAFVGMQNGSATLEDKLAFLPKLDIFLLYNSANILFGIYPKELKFFYPHRNLHMLIAALFIIDTTWKQPRCPSLGEWINKS